MDEVRGAKGPDVLCMSRLNLPRNPHFAMEFPYSFRVCCLPIPCNTLHRYDIVADASLKLEVFSARTLQLEACKRCLSRA